MKTDSPLLDWERTRTARRQKRELFALRTDAAVATLRSVSHALTVEANDESVLDAHGINYTQGILRAVEVLGLVEINLANYVPRTVETDLAEDR